MCAILFFATLAVLFCFVFVTTSWHNIMEGPAPPAAAAHPSVEGLVHRSAGAVRTTASYLPEPVDPPVPGACAESHSAGPAGQSQQQERANTPAENNNTASGSEAAGRFVCHICLNSPDKPVVTVCGHLHCWGCLYKWLALHRDDPQCPVCKAGIEMPGADPSKARVVPLYVGDETCDPRHTVPEDPTLPQRPPGERPEPQRRAGIAMPGLGAFGPAMGYPQLLPHAGLLPSLFGLAFETPHGPQGAGAAHGAEDGGGGGGGEGGPRAADAVQAAQAAIQQQEAAQQEFLSRLLFMIGTFIALCLIFFP